MCARQDNEPQKPQEPKNIVSPPLDGCPRSTIGYWVGLATEAEGPCGAEASRGASAGKAGSEEINRENKSS